MSVTILLSMRSFVSTLRRSKFLLAAIALVTIFWLLLNAFAAGTRHSLLHSATTLVTGHINVGGFYKSNPSDVAAVMVNADAIEDLLQQNTPDLKRLMRRYRGWGKAISDRGSLQTGMIGISIEEEPDLYHLLLPADRYFVPTASLAELQQKNSVVLFEEQARRLQVQVGDQITIRIETFGGRANTADAKVIYVAQDLGVLSNFSMIVPNELLRELYQLREDTAGVFHLLIDDIHDAPDVAQHVREKLLAKGYDVLPNSEDPFFLKLQDLTNESWLGQQLDITTWNEEVSYLTWILTALSSLNAILTTILALIITVGIMNTLWISVRRRTPEIGTLRAIGMGRGHVMRMLLYEALWLGTLGTCAGALVGGGLCGLLEQASIRIPNEAFHAILMSETIHFRLSVWDLVRSILMFTALVVVSALPPAFRAARVPPITAIHQVD